MKMRTGSPDRTRRLLTLAGMMLPFAGTAFAQQEEDGEYTEVQRGDADLAAERVTFNPDAVVAFSSAKTRSIFTPRVETFRTDFLTIGQSFVGTNRWDSEARVARLLSQFGVPFRDGNGNYVAYCAAGISLVAALVYLQNATGSQAAANAATPAPAPFDPDSILNIASDEVGRFMPEVSRYHFYPTVSVVNMFHVALGTRRWKERDVTPKPGWVVIFDWDKKDTLYSADHCGIVESADSGVLQTIEFNTRFDPGGQGTERDGGWVARRARPIGPTIKGYIDTGRANPFW